MPVFTDYPTIKQTSLNDIIGPLANFQQYQQAQQLNPIQLEAAQLQLEQAKKINPVAFQKAQLELQKQQETQQSEIARIQSESRQQLGTEKPVITQQEQAAEQSKLLTKKQKYELDAKQAEDANNEFGSLLTDNRVLKAHEDPEAAKDALIEIRSRLEKRGIDPKTVEAHTRPLFDLIEKKPEVLTQALSNIVNRGQNEAQFGQFNQAPVAVNTGLYQNLVPVSPFQKNRPIQSFEMNLTPGQREVPTGRFDMENNPTAFVYSANGKLLGEKTIKAGVPENTAQMPNAPQGAGPLPPQFQIPPTANAPTSNAPVRLAPYETADTVAAARAKQAEANEAAKGVNQTQFNNNQIIKLADEALTGKGAQAIANLGGGYAAIPFTLDATSNLQQLGHYMSLETANLAKSSGLGTDAARGIASQVSGTPEWTRDSIKSTARINRALSTGTDLYNRGINAAIAKNNNNPLAGREFSNKWSSTADINALKLMDAVRNNDTSEIKKIVDELGGPNTEKYQKLLLKAGTLNNLVKGQ